MRLTNWIDNRWLAGAAGRSLDRHRERRELRRCPQMECPGAERLARSGPEDVRSLCESAAAAEEWSALQRELSSLSISIPERALGVNPGDRRAVYHLVRYFRPQAVLEIGTHIGASTVSIAAALRRDRREQPGCEGRLTTVDIEDVNSESEKPWLRYGAGQSPRQVMHRLGTESHTTFVTGSSSRFFDSCPDSFDFIFLDGDHSAATVYREIPPALARLRPGGAILLHDYFPGGRPLWSDGRVQWGPWMAVQRLRDEGAGVAALPMGELPWATKLGSQVTSLALLVPESPDAHGKHTA